MRLLSSFPGCIPLTYQHSYGRIFERIKANVPRGSLEKVTKLFALIAFAQRPLTLRELLDGLALSTEPYAVNERTKRTSERELDPCKPLVELNPVSSTVTFVHFTVKA